jgi:hypothetical protein
MPSRSWLQIAARLAGMNRHEILDRSRQELSKRADSFLSKLGFDFSSGMVGSANLTPARFFFAPESVERVLHLIRQRLPQQAEQIVRQADKICRHEFDLLGYEDLDYGDPIEWHLDRVHGKQAPKKAFYKIRYLDFDEVGDSKVTWELNRHQHLVTLAKAFRLTKDRRYADEIFQQWRHWHTENPYAVGINWASSLEVAFRSLSWIWMYELLAGTSAMPPEFRKEWLRAQALNGRYIERYLSTYFSPNTHLLGEGVALLFLGTMCPEISRADHWKSRRLWRQCWTLYCCSGAPALRRDWATTTEAGCSIADVTAASTCWILLRLEPCFSIEEISKQWRENCARRRSGCWENRALPTGIAFSRSQQARLPPACRPPESTSSPPQVP